jgi:hypothetical protein
MKRTILLGALVIAVSTAFAHKIRVDFDHDTHFSCYKTYRWVEPAYSGPEQVQFPNQLMQERVTVFIDEALAARGLKRVTKGGDLLISYRINVTEQPVLSTFYSGAGPGWASGWGSGWGWGWGWGSGVATTTLQTYYEGTLVINMMDPKDNQLVFQGTSTQAVSSRPQKNTKKLAKAVNEVFERFPPRL